MGGRGRAWSGSRSGMNDDPRRVRLRRVRPRLSLLPGDDRARRRAATRTCSAGCRWSTPPTSRRGFRRRSTSNRSGEVPHPFGFFGFSPTLFDAPHTDRRRLRTSSPTPSSAGWAASCSNSVAKRGAPCSASAGASRSAGGELDFFGPEPLAGRGLERATCAYLIEHLPAPGTSPPASSSTRWAVTDSPRPDAPAWSSASCGGGGSTTSGCWRRWARCRGRRSCPQRLRDRAYADSALPIAEEQTISQPWIVAAICQALRAERLRAGARGRHRLRLLGRRALAAGRPRGQRRAPRGALARRRRGAAVARESATSS